MGDHKPCPACQRDTMHLCTERHTTYRFLRNGLIEVGESEAVHWHCDKCGHRLDLKKDERIPPDAYIYRPRTDGLTKAGSVNGTND